MLDILPVQLPVKVICRRRYACQACDTPITQASAPPRPIDGGMATEALISWRSSISAQQSLVGLRLMKRGRQKTLHVVKDLDEARIKIPRAVRAK
jgi:hypothetical protein